MVGDGLMQCGAVVGAAVMEFKQDRFMNVRLIKVQVMKVQGDTQVSRLTELADLESIRAKRGSA